MKKQNKLFINFLSITLCFVFILLPLSTAQASSHTTLNWIVNFAGAFTKGVTSDLTKSVSCLISGGFVDCVLQGIAYVMNFINTFFLGNIIWVVANAINIVLQFTTFVDNDAVNTGWTIMRDFANMFFILVMLWISIVTILDLPQYQTQKLLAGVIMIAVLINFSRVIAFTVVDFSHIFLNAFLNAFKNTQGQIDIAVYLGQALQINSMNVPTSSTAAIAGQASTSYGGIVATVLFHTLLLILILAALIAVVFLFIARMIILWALVMLSPLAFIGRILPAKVKAQTWDKWWPALFSWSFVAPIYMFFIYITVKLAGPNGVLSLIQQSNQSSVLASGTAGANAIPFVNNMTVGNLIVMAVVIGFLLLGLKMSLGIAGATGSAVVSLGTKGLSMVGGGITGGLRRGAAILGRTAQKSYQQQVDAGKTPTGMRGLLYGATARLTAGAQARYKQDIEDKKDELKKKYGDNVLALQNRLVTAGLGGKLRSQEQTAIIERLGELRGGFKSDDPLIKRRIDDGIYTAARLGFRPKSRPDLAAIGSKNPSEDIEKAIGKIRGRDKDLENLSIDAFRGEFGEETTQAALKHWSGAHMGALLRVNDEVFDHIRDALLKMGSTTDQVATKLENMGATKMATYVRSSAAQDSIGLKPSPQTPQSSVTITENVRDNVRNKTRFDSQGNPIEEN